MKPFTYGLLTLSCLLVVATRVTADEAKDSPPQQEELGEKIIGTWKLVSAKYGGQTFQFPEGATMVKHVTPTHFMWATYDEDGNVTRAAGGPYTLEGNKYAETVKYGLGNDFAIIHGKTHTFRCEIEDNTWRHNGELANGLKIEEIWKRVEAETK